mgnify:CR=1 FL=1
MRNVSLVCSAHGLNGACNHAELLRILRVIEPDVIFLEVRPSDFQNYYQAMQNQEVLAVTEYRNLKLFK